MFEKIWSAMQSKNLFLSEHWFMRIEGLQDRRSAWLIFPGLWVKKRRPGLEVKECRLTVGWGQWRLSCVVGEFKPFPDSLTEQHQEQLESFLKWSKNIFGKTWTRLELEKMFIQQPEWQELVIVAGANHHYTKVLLAREMIALKDNHPLRSASAIPDQRENEIFRTKEKREKQEEMALTEAFSKISETQRDTTMEDLEALEHRIRAKK